MEGQHAREAVRAADTLRPRHPLVKVMHENLARDERERLAALLKK